MLVVVVVVVVGGGGRGGAGGGAVDGFAAKTARTDVTGPAFKTQTSCVEQGAPSQWSKREPEAAAAESFRRAPKSTVAVQVEPQLIELPLTLPDPTVVTRNLMLTSKGGAGPGVFPKLTPTYRFSGWARQVGTLGLSPGSQPKTHVTEAPGVFGVAVRGTGVPAASDSLQSGSA